MRATGIVRRIDELGRVVVPKEIRRIMRIKEGDPLEIFTEASGEIVLKKYSHVGELEQFANDYVQALGNTSQSIALITDTDQVIAGNGNAKKLNGRRISDKLINVINNREQVVAGRGDVTFIEPVEELEDDYVSLQEYFWECICPIITNGDVAGAVIMLNKSNKEMFVEADASLAKCAADFIGRYISQ